MKKLYTTLVLLCSLASLGAQVEISGRVTDKMDGTPLIGATVREKDGSSGAISGVDGTFKLNVASTASTLVFKYTGYTDLEIPLNGRTSLEVVMGEDANLLEQVVVVGYGTQLKSDLTGSVGSVKTRDIERIPTASLDQALQGKVAGVYVTPSSGEPGAGAIIRIRGTGTLNNASPIYVIDGMITYDASFVNPQDVASVEILKDASASAIYGARGANGVILITTKSGRRREKAVISLSSYYSSQDLTKTIPLLNAADFGQAYNELVNQAYYPDPAALGTGTDWQQEIFRKAPMGSLQLSANGGSDRFSYNISGNYFNQSGILKNSEFERYTLRINTEFQVNRWLNIGNNLAYSNVARQIAPGGAVTSAYRMPPVFAPIDSTGDFSDPTMPFGLAISNPAAELFYRSNNKVRSDRFFGTLYGEVALFKWLKFRSNFGFDLDYNREKQFTPPYEVSASQINRVDQLWQRFGQKRDWIWEQTLTLDQTWGRHRLNVLAGYTAEERAYESFGASRSGFPGLAETLLYLDAGNDTTQFNYGSASDEALISYLFRTNYTFRDRYLFTVTARVDQSSRFAEQNRTGVFPSFSVGWNAGQEAFVESLNLFDRLKFRASYGLLGNQNSIRNRYYPSLGIITSRLYYVFGPGESLNQGASLISIGNPDLVWETARQTDIGVEVGLFNNRFTAEIDWYNRYTFDIIAPVPIPDYVGSASDPVVNTAKVRNTGWDITLNWRQTGRVSWNVGTIFSPVKNELIALNDQKAEILAAFLQGEPATRSEPGIPVGSFYGYKVIGVFDSADEAASAPRLGNETAGDLQYADLNGDGKIDAKDRTNLGSPIPTLTYGFTAGVEFGGFDLAADLFGVSGNKVFNAKKTFRFSVYNWEQTAFDDRWTPTNTTGSTPRITNGGHNYRVSDYFLEDGSFVRLRSLVLGYSLPAQVMQKIRVSRLRFYVSGTNLWTSQKYSGYAPEFGNDNSPYEVGFDFGGYPIAKSIQIGLDASF